jgi:hypothetical protein
MNPGRELDLLVAEKVMGRTVSDNPDPIIFKRGDFESHISGPDTIPNYSTDISAAWEVVEKLRKEGILLEIKPISEEIYTYRNAVRNAGMSQYATIVHGYICNGIEADTAPHAICLAALRVAGVEV